MFYENLLAHQYFGVGREDTLAERAQLRNQQDYWSSKPGALRTAVDGSPGNHVSQ